VDKLQDYKPQFPRWEAKTIQQLLPAELPRGGHHLLANLLTYNPSLRLTARAALGHEYLASAPLVAPPVAHDAAAREAKRRRVEPEA